MLFVPRAPAIITPPPRRIYLDRDASELFCLVDAEDYDWAIQWRWSFTPDRHKRKFYATRTTKARKISPNTFKIYMHKAILIDRKKEKPPSPQHTIGDHRDGDSLNDQRGNLRWFTPSQNRRTART